MTRIPHAVLMTSRIFGGMSTDFKPHALDVELLQDLGLESSVGKAHYDWPCDEVQILRNTILAVKTHERSTHGRGLAVVDLREEHVLSIWYVDQATCAAIFERLLPAQLWQPIATLLQSYTPVTTAIALYLVADTMEVIVVDSPESDEPSDTWNIAPVKIPALPYPLVQEQLPPFAFDLGVTSWCEYGPSAMSYVFTHHQLGDLGRIHVGNDDDGCLVATPIVAEIPGDSQMPEREALLLSLTHDMLQHLERYGGVHHSSGRSGIRLPTGLPPMAFPDDMSEPIATTVLRCEACGDELVLLIFGDNPGMRLDDYARHMRDVIHAKNLTTFIIGPIEGYSEDDVTDEQSLEIIERSRQKLKTGSLMSLIAHDPLDEALLLLDEPMSPLMKVWPSSEPIREVKPTHFKRMVADLSAAHCKR